MRGKGGRGGGGGGGGGDGEGGGGGERSGPRSRGGGGGGSGGGGGRALGLEGPDLIGEANEELVVWETDADGGKCGHMVPFENPKEFVACVVRNVAKAKTENV